MKACSTCHTIKEADGFYASKGKLMASCKECQKAKALAWKRENTERMRDYEASRQQHRREMTAAWQMVSKAKFPERVKARNAVRNAIRKGQMQRGNCIVCGKPEAHAHHADYSKPLEVSWLCHAHHWHMHRKDTPTEGICFAPPDRVTARDHFVPMTG